MIINQISLVTIMILTHTQAKELLEANKKGLKETEISLDLNKTLSKVKIQNSEFIFPENQ